MGSSDFRSSMSDEFLMKSKQCLPWVFENREFCAKTLESSKAWTLLHQLGDCKGLQEESGSNITALRSVCSSLHTWTHILQKHPIQPKMKPGLYALTSKIQKLVNPSDSGKVLGSTKAQAISDLGSSLQWGVTKWTSREMRGLEINNITVKRLQEPVESVFSNIYNSISINLKTSCKALGMDK